MSYVTENIVPITVRVNKTEIVVGEERKNTSCYYFEMKLFYGDLHELQRVYKEFRQNKICGDRKVTGSHVTFLEIQILVNDEIHVFVDYYDQEIDRVSKIGKECLPTIETKYECYEQFEIRKRVENDSLIELVVQMVGSLVHLYQISTSFKGDANTLGQFMRIRLNELKNMLQKRANS